MNELWRTLRMAAWLGWQVESNWTEPWLFAIYVLIKPFTGSLLLICMYWAARTATQGGVPEGFMPFLYVGNACFLMVAGVTFGMSWAVIADREHYGMLKYIYISPAHFQTYLIGRGAAGAAESFLGALLTLLIGLLLAPLFPELALALLWDRPFLTWLWLIVFLLLGTLMLIELGLILAAAVLNMGRYAFFLSEGISGVLYLLSGVVFPIGTLPDQLQPFSLAVPVTYWLEGMRRCLLDPHQVKGLPGWQEYHLAGMLLFSVIVLGVAAQYFFHWSERRAWRRGKLDEQTGM